MCDSSGYVLGVLEKYTGVADLRRLRRRCSTSVDLDAVRDRHAVADCTRAMVRAALERGLHVFCEKPFTPRPARRRASSPRSPRERGLVTQVGYHNRFVGAFARGQAAARRRRDRHGHARARRGVRPGRAQAQGRHLAQPQASEGGGCLYDYAAHPLNLLNWYFGEPTRRRRHRAQPDLLARDRRRGLRHPVLRRRRERAASRSTGRDESLPQDDDPDHDLGHRRAGSTPTARRSRSTCATRRRVPDGYEHGLERPLHDRADRAGLVLPARRGVQRPDRRTSSSASRSGRARRRQRLRERGRRPTA